MWDPIDDELVTVPRMLREGISGQVECQRGTATLPRSVERFVMLYRVSTTRQQKSGLGLEAQRQACLKLVARAGGIVLREYREVVSGASRKRPELESAVLLCRREAATLLVYRVDRLSRTLTAIPDIMRQGVKVVVATMPSITPEMLVMMSAIAADELRRISRRQKAASAARRARRVVDSNKPRMVFHHSIRAAGPAVKAAESMSLHRLERDAAVRLRAQKMTYARIAEQIMLDFPLSGRVRDYTVRRWVKDKRSVKETVAKADALCYAAKAGSARKRMRECRQIRQIARLAVSVGGGEAERIALANADADCARTFVLARTLTIGASEKINELLSTTK